MARRVNTRFLIVLTAVVGVLVVAAFAALALSRNDDPQQFVRDGDRLTAEGQYELALQNYRQAVTIEQRDAGLWVKLGDAFNRLGGNDVDNVALAQQAWTKALEIEPANTDALARLLALNEELLDFGQDVARRVDEARSAAEKLAAADPTDTRAAAAIHEVTLRGWRMGVQTDAAKVDAAMTGLAAVAAKRPADPEPPYQLALAKLQRAQEQGRQGDREAARAALAEAETIVVDATGANPDSAAMHFRASQVLSLLAGVQDTPEARQSVTARVREHLARARELTKPDGEHYVQVMVATARLQHPEDRAAALRTIREMLAAKPDDQAGRLEAAALLAADAAGRDEAAALLEQPIVAREATGARAYLLRGLEAQTAVALTNLRLDQYAATTDPAARERLMAKIEDGLSKAVAHLGEEKPPVLKLRGKLQRFQGKHVEAIQTLTKAKNVLDQQGAQRDVNYYEVLDQLARAYVDTQQTGAAIGLLEQLADRVEGHVPTRLLLATLLVKDKRFADAAEHIAFLEKALPQHPEIVKLRLAALAGTGTAAGGDGAADAADANAGAAAGANAERLAELYARLPEQTKGEMLDKANTALAIGQRDDAVRLLTAAHERFPNEVDVVVALARAYVARGEREQAAAVIADALAANPDNAGLKMLAQQLADGGATPEDVRKLQREAVANVADPVTRELALAELDRADGKPGDALARLRRLEQEHADNQKVLEGLFAHHVAARQWGEAEPYLERLARMNADQAGGLLFRYRFAMARGDAAAALTHARDLAARMPEFALSWLSLGQALQANGKPEEAVERYRRVLELQGDNPDALRGLIESYLALGRADEAKRFIEQGARAHPTNGYFREVEIAWEVAHGDPQNAIGPRREAVERQPDSPQAWAALVQAYASAARARLAKADQAGAREHLTKSQETAREATAKFPDDRRFYAAVAEAALTLKNPADGEAALRQLAARDAWKDRPEPLLMLADFYARAGRTPDAEQALRDAVAAHPESVEAQLALASLLAQTNRADDALAVLRVANPDEPRVLRQRVELLIALGQLDEADKALAAALDKSPGSTELLAVSGFVNLQRRKYAEATARLEQALALEPNNAVAMYYLAQVKQQQPKPDVNEAVRLLTAARDLQPQFTDVRFELARAHRRRNDTDGAARELEAALQAQPTNKRIRMALVDAYQAFVPPRWIEIERALREGREMPQFKSDPELIAAEARMWLARRDGTRASELMREAVAASGENPAVVREYLDVLLEARDYDAVAREAERRLASDPNAWWAQLARAVARRRGGDKDGAIADFEQALTTANAFVDDAAAREVIRTVARELGVDEALSRIEARAKAEPRWRIVAAQFQQAKGDLPAAAATVEAALADADRLTPADREAALRVAGVVYLASQPPRADKAYDAYRQLLALRPDDLFALNNLACLLAETVDPPRPGDAIQYSQRAYDLMASAGRREPMVLDTHGWVLTLVGRTDEGIDLLRQAVAAQPFAEGYYHLAEAYLKGSFPEEALRNLELARQEIAAAEDAKRLVDESLKRRVEDATKRAKDAIGAKASARILP